jgi:hypothetical protein
VCIQIVHRAEGPGKAISNLHPFGAIPLGKIIDERKLAAYV